MVFFSVKRKGLANGWHDDDYPGMCVQRVSLKQKSKREKILNKMFLKEWFEYLISYVFYLWSRTSSSLYLQHVDPVKGSTKGPFTSNVIH